MLNLLTKTKPWMVASLLVATSVFGQDSGPCPKPCPPKCEQPCPKPCPPKPCPPKPCAPCPQKSECTPCPPPCPQPCPPTQVCPPPPCSTCPPWATPVLNAGYNYPARTITRCAWDIFIDAAFLYWQPIQENMELATFLDPAVTTASAVSLVNMNFKYKPGFKVSLGGNPGHDNWDIHAEYTWFHNTHSRTITTTPGTVTGAFFPARGSLSQSNHMSQSWNLKMDIAELDLGRWHYVGTKLIFRPNFGARAAWIRQNVKINNSGLLDLLVAIVPNPGTINARSTSWAVGPQVGLNANYLIGSGFRLYGKGEGDILFTRYNRLSFKQVQPTTSPATALTVVTVKQNKYNCLRTHLDLELGLGWGTYLDCNNWYMDFAAGYEFQVYFDQNMFRQFGLTGAAFTKSFSPNGNLYVHGLTATFRLDF